MKITIEKVKEEVESFGWKVKSDTYTNLKTQMEFECPEGHTVLTSFEKIRRTREHTHCPICAQKESWTEEKLEGIKKSKDTITRVLAFDQASIISGWALFDDNELKKFGNFHLDENQPVSVRLNNFHARLLNMIEIYQPDVLVFEDIQLQNFGGKNEVGVTTYKVLAAVLGICQMVSAETNIPHYIVHSATWRNFLNIKGRTRTDRKRSAQLLIRQIYEVNVSEDEADAICLGSYGARHYQKKPKMVKW